MINKRMLEEETVHAEGIAWLTQNRNYRELFEDPDESTNARLVSVGLMAERLCLIGVKVQVGPGEARHIESKLSGSFRGHADPTNTHPQFLKMRELWDGRSVPLVATLARRYTKRGLEDLTTMLQRRAAEWGFDFEIWQLSESEPLPADAGSLAVGV